MEKITYRYNHGKYIMLHLSNGTRILEHRYLMQLYLKRKLTKGEVVHHKDNNGRNNLINNLEVLSLKEHTRYHVRLLRPRRYVQVICNWCEQEFNMRLNKYKYANKLGQKHHCSKKCSARYSISTRQRILTYNVGSIPTSRNKKKLYRGKMK